MDNPIHIIAEHLRESGIEPLVWPHGGELEVGDVCIVWRRRDSKVYIVDCDEKFPEHKAELIDLSDPSSFEIIMYHIKYDRNGDERHGS